MNSDRDIVKNAAPEFISQALISGFDRYKEMYKKSIEDPESFWASIAEEFYWNKKWDRVCEYNFDMREGPISVQWFLGATTNICYNAVDRHVTAGKGDKTAIIFEGNNVSESGSLTYSQLLEQVCKFSNVLKKLGVQKGDTVAIYMPMIPELPVAMLACARIGAIHSVVFGGFSAEALALRISDAGSKVVVTADGVFRANKKIPLKAAVDEAVGIAAKEGVDVHSVVVFKRLGDGSVKWVPGRDRWWHEDMEAASPVCDVEWMDAEDPLFMLYTSGSTGKPKGVLHTCGGYMVYAATTFKYIFDIHEHDIWWCTADCGWVTGHSYVVYGPLCTGATTLVFEGVPNFPDPGRNWAIVDKYKVTQFYTAPTAIRALMREGDQWVTKHSRASLKVLGSVGEPINPDAWLWYYNVVGSGRCPIVDTWWQTETGGILITPLPGAIPMKPGSATLPFFGIEPAVLDEHGKEQSGSTSGYLVIKRPWPGIMRTVYRDHARYENTYFANYKGFYFTGDGCLRDNDGYYWITGRVDDVINVSGHRIGSAEVENALVHHPAVAEAAVVGYPHDIKGQGIFCFVTPKEGCEPTIDELKATVRKHLGPLATPDVIIITTSLPKTRSGKIMRRILRKIACKEIDSLGDTSTLADPKVVDILISLVQAK